MNQYQSVGVVCGHGVNSKLSHESHQVLLGKSQPHSAVKGEKWDNADYTTL